MQSHATNRSSFVLDQVLENPCPQAPCVARILDMKACFTSKRLLLSYELTKQNLDVLQNYKGNFIIHFQWGVKKTRVDFVDGYMRLTYVCV